MSSTHLEPLGEPDADLARWLVEAGRRGPTRHARAHEPPAVMPRRSASDGEGRLRALRRIALTTVLAVSTAQYLYLDATLTMLRLPILVVFVSEASAR